MLEALRPGGMWLPGNAWGVPRFSSQNLWLKGSGDGKDLCLTPWRLLPIRGDKTDLDRPGFDSVEDNVIYWRMNQIHIS